MFVSIAALLGGVSSGALAQQLPRDPEVMTVGSSYSGTFCEPDMFDVSNGPGILAFSSHELDAFNADPGTVLEGSCQANIDLEIPAGFSVTGGRLCVEYTVSGVEDEVLSSEPAQLNVTYGFAASGLKQLNISSGLTDGLAQECVDLDFWSPCSGAGSERFTLHFDARAPYGTIVAVSAFRANFPKGLEAWRSCDGGTVVAEPARRYQDCSAASGRPCEEGLRCEPRIDIAGRTVEICRVPGETPRAAGEVCESEQQCADQLICASTDEGTTWTCLTDDEFRSE